MIYRVLASIHALRVRTKFGLRLYPMGVEPFQLQVWVLYKHMSRSTHGKGAPIPEGMRSGLAVTREKASSIS